MRRLTRDEPSEESGAALILTAMVMFSLLAVSAFVVDVGALVAERRILQNGADAAALAVAQDCASTGCGPYQATATGLASANADDGVSTVNEVCGTSPLPACTAPPAVPTGAGYVRVQTESLTAGGSNQVPFTFARIMGFTGATVTRRTTVAWGGPAALTSQLPLTISVCEFNFYTGNGTAFATPSPPYPPYPPNERTIYFHTKAPMPSGCPSSQAGADLPGGFGWLATATDCATPSSADGWFNDKTGRPAPASCDPPEMAAMRGKVAYVPVYDLVNGLNGNNGQYHIEGYAAFYLTGYSITGQHRQRSLVSSQFPCGGNDSCISGYFVRDQPAPGTIGGPSMGVVVIQVIG